MLGGRAAEELIFKEITTGASDDIAKATNVARTMVAEYGMSDLGPINLDNDNGRRSPYDSNNISPEMAAKIDAQVKLLTDEAYKEAVNILKKLRTKMDILAEELLKKETIESEEFQKLIGDKPNQAKLT
jgi:cell division protease FtsH